jgi:hypothetical protein
MNLLKSAFTSALLKGLFSILNHAMMAATISDVGKRQQQQQGGSAKTDFDEQQQQQLMQAIAAGLHVMMLAGCCLALHCLRHSNSAGGLNLSIFCT